MASSILAWALAYWLRFNLTIPHEQLSVMWHSLAWVVPLQTIIFWRFGLYRGIWRYASLPDIKRILLAVSVATLATILLLFMLRLTDQLPRSVFLLDPLLLVLIMGGSRVAYRAWKERRVSGLLTRGGQPVIILGAGDAAVALVKELSRSDRWRVMGLLDDNPAKRGRLLQGISVLGSVNTLSTWVQHFSIGTAIIAMPEASHHDRRCAVDTCAVAGIEALTVPSFQDLLSGDVTISQIRKIEVEDLLGRDPVLLDDAGLHGFLGKRVVMVTGAGGSIGSELCRQIARFSPQVLLLFEQNEFALYRMEQEFAENLPAMHITCAIGDVKDSLRVAQVMAQYRPAVVFHAAAYKHVPLMEQENAWQAVKNNVLGTYICAREAMRYGVEKFVLISTDKAVNPTNVMGASKRLAEMVCQGLQHKAATGFVMVRFGNVLGSAGSVIPKFQEQLAKGGPLTVTHPEITRYFMSIPEAAQLVLQAGLMGKGGEIFVLDMGAPVKIVDLARDMIRLSGFGTDEISIVYTGLRPGEKLFEELLANDELSLPTPHPKVWTAKARAVKNGWLDMLMDSLGKHDSPDDDEVKRLILRWVPEYQPMNCVCAGRTTEEMAAPGG